MRTRKVLQIISSLGVGGAETMILELSKGLDFLRVDNHIGVLSYTKNPQIELPKAAQQNNLSVQVFNCRGRIDVRTMRDIKRFIRQHDIQIIQTHGYKANFYALLCSDAKKTIRIATCHPWTETGVSLKARFYTKLDKAWLNRFDKIVAISDAVKEEISQIGISNSKVTVIDNGIDVHRFNGPFTKESARKKFGLPANKFVVGTIGRMIEEKGHDIFLKAARSLVQRNSNLLFVIVGDGPLMNQLAKQRSQLGIEKHVLLLGRRTEIPELLKTFDLFVLSSLSEGLPMVILEAMAAQKPIIATRVGAIPRVIQDGDSGLLIEPNAADLQKAILELLGDRAKADRLAQLARERIIKHFSSKSMAEKYLQLYDQAFGEKMKHDSELQY